MARGNGTMLVSGIRWCIFAGQLVAVYQCDGISMTYSTNVHAPTVPAGQRNVAQSTLRPQMMTETCINDTVSVLRTAFFESESAGVGEGGRMVLLLPGGEAFLVCLHSGEQALSAGQIDYHARPNRATMSPLRDHGPAGGLFIG